MNLGRNSFKKSALRQSGGKIDDKERTFSGQSQNFPPVPLRVNQS